MNIPQPLCDIIQIGEEYPTASSGETIRILSSVEIPGALLFSVRLEYENLPPRTELNQFYELKMSTDFFYCIRVATTFKRTCFDLAADLDLQLVPVEQILEDIQARDTFFLMNLEFSELSANKDLLNMFAYRKAIQKEDEAINAIFRAHGEAEIPSRSKYL